jgi:hypothetical protein
MIRDFGGGEVFVAVISARRPHRVRPMTRWTGEATWIVAPEDVPAYRAEIDKLGLELPLVPVEGLAAARNRALDLAFERGVPCLQVSDDLSGLWRLLPDGSTCELSFDGAARLLREELEMSDFRLAGAAPTDNPFYASEHTGSAHFIVGDLILVGPTPLRFDERFLLKEDYDYTCQHYATYGGVVRLNWLLARFAHRTNPGGAVAIRTAELERRMIALLKGKWGDWIRDHPKRPNEVILRLPQRRRELAA